jgi:hypothetical protein
MAMLFLLSLSSPVFSAISQATCRISNGSLTITDEIDTSGYAWGTWNASIFDIGWHSLHITGNPSVPEPDMMRCAGAVEGYLSHSAIYDHFIAILQMYGWSLTAPHYPDGWKEYMQANIDYVNQSVQACLEVGYWQTIGLVFKQFEGLVEGYAIAGGDQNMTVIDHWILQSEGDLGDVSNVVSRWASGGGGGPTVRLSREDLANPPVDNEHCTGLIKLTKNFSDIYFAHDAWSNYSDMFGTLKDYHLPVGNFSAKQIVMSTRPGKLSSYDDYYIADSGLLVLETTMSLLNPDLYQFLGPQTLFTWLRAIHATWISPNGSEWTSNFIRHNSGTYNNQYLVLDSNKFLRGQKPTTDLLWVIEQFPGDNWRRADVTQKLVTDGFFPSINKPSFPELFEIAGYPEQVAAAGPTGNYWTYETSARYLLIQREAPRLDDFNDYRKFMRYNNWARDLFSNGDSAQMISARADLRSYKNPYGPVKGSGGMDSKTARLTHAVTRLAFTAIASPVHDNGNSVWSFTGFLNETRAGLPDVWEFDNLGWQDFAGEGYALCAKFTKKKDCEEQKWCGWCGFTEDHKDGVCFAGDKEGPFFPDIDKCEGSFSVEQKLPGYAVGLIASISAIVVVVIIAIGALHYYNLQKRF